MESAFKSSRKQLAGVDSSLLVVGGFNLNESDVVLLSQACRRHFERTKGARKNLVGAMIYFPRPELWLVESGPNGKVEQLTMPTFAPLIKNERYEGLMNLDIVDG